MNGPDTPIGGLTVTLLDSAGLPLNDHLGNPITTTTQADGSYSFTSLPSGTYQTRVESAVGAQTYDVDDGGNPASFTTPHVSGPIELFGPGNPDTANGLTAADYTDVIDAVNINFSYTGIMSVGNLVWLDENNNGLLDGAESGIDGVDVEIYNSTSVLVGQTTTTSGGLYRFDNLLQGDYIVIIPCDQLNAGAALFGLVSSSGSYMSAGPYEPAPDVDANMTDSDDNGSVDTSDGCRLTSGTFTLMSGAEPINDGDASADTNFTVDFGLFGPPATLGDYVWVDQDGDGVQDADEPGIDDVVVTLYDASTDNVLATTVTGDNPATSAVEEGYYCFCMLPAGMYYLDFQLPTGFEFTGSDTTVEAEDSDAVPSADGGFGRTPVYTLVLGENIPDVDAGVQNTEVLSETGSLLALIGLTGGISLVGASLFVAVATRKLNRFSISSRSN